MYAQYGGAKKERFQKKLTILATQHP